MTDTSSSGGEPIAAAYEQFRLLAAGLAAPRRAPSPLAVRAETAATNPSGDPANPDPGTPPRDGGQQVTAGGAAKLQPAFAGTLKLSQPTMLGATQRWYCAWAALALALVAVAGVIVLAAASHSAPTAGYVVLGVIAALALVAAMIFVMGYGNVDIEGSSGAEGSGESGGSTGSGAA